MAVLCSHEDMFVVVHSCAQKIQWPRLRNLFAQTSGGHGGEKKQKTHYTSTPNLYCLREDQAT